MRAGDVAFCVVTVLAALLLGACSARDPLVTSAGAAPVGNWRVERQTDRITNAPVSSAYVMADGGGSNSAIDFRRPVMVQLTCLKAEPVIRFTFQFKVGSNRNSVLGYRFDDKPGRDANARFLQNDMTVVIEEPADVLEFLKELGSSKLLYIRIRSLTAGRSTAEFRLDGAPAAIDQALAGCYSPIGTPRRGSA